MNVEGRSAIVTGGGSGMGFAAARLLASRGCRVALLGRRKSLVEQRAREIGGLGLACDVADEAAVAAAFDAAERAHGPAAILVHAAGDGRMATLLQADGAAAPTAALREILDTNLLGTLLVAREMAARLNRGGVRHDGVRGVIVNVSSIGAADGGVGAAYAASKGGVDALTQTLARELGPWRIRVVTIAPGAIDTEMLRAGAVDGTMQLIAGQTLATRRAGRPGEFAALVLHVCENDYLNGCRLRLDGGMRIPYSFDIGGGAVAPDAS